MGQVKEINTKNRIHYFFSDMINLDDFDLSLLKIDKKSYKDIYIYHIEYIAIKKIDYYENIHSVNPLYLIIHSAIGYFKEKNNDKYLILDSTDKYEEFGLALNQKSKQFMVEKNVFIKKTTLELELILW